jgi:hypothetical protein
VKTRIRRRGKANVIVTIRSPESPSLLSLFESSPLPRLSVFSSHITLFLLFIIDSTTSRRAAAEKKEQIKP